MRKHLPMTGNPALLVQTGIRVAVSSVFGQFADRRQAIAAANAIVAQPFDPSYDYSSQTTGCSGRGPRRFTIAKNKGEEALFSRREESKKRPARNWSFAFRNPGMVVVFGVAILTTWFLVVFRGNVWPDVGWIAGLRGVSSIILASLGAAFASAMLLGLYLWVSLNRFGRHWSEAFSSLAIADFENFLRLRIDRNDRLTGYPIGLRRVPEGGRSPESLHPHLIEEPVSIS